MSNFLRSGLENGMINFLHWMFHGREFKENVE